MANHNQYPSQAIKAAKDKLYVMGRKVEQETWQSKESPDDTWELLNHKVSFPMPLNKDLLVPEVRPNLPWADKHFEERVGGRPLNPPPSADIWPFNAGSKEFRTDTKYDHTYPERFWPKYAGHFCNSELLDPNYDGPYIRPNKGVKFEYGDLNDVINLIKKYPHTRQAFLPVWFPEDTGSVEGQRVPCTLGYHFIMRNGFLHMNYYIRSCDIIRHFRDDIYLAVRLLYYVLNRATSSWESEVLPGMFNMYITSLHCFYSEKEILKQSNI